MKDIENMFDEKPDERLWKRLEDKLEKKKSLKKLRFYRVSAVAAMGAAVLFAVTYFNHLLDDHNPHLFASNEGFTSFVLEEIAHEEEGLFNMASFREIREAYSVVDDSNNEILSLVGSYTGSDGEMGLEIQLSEYTYMLDFDFDGLPTLELLSVQGQTLYFESAEGATLKMNVEPYGLRLIDASFLPEYKNYEFNKIGS